MQQVLVGIYPV